MDGSSPSSLVSSNFEESLSAAIERCHEGIGSSQEWEYLRLSKSDLLRDNRSGDKLNDELSPEERQLETSAMASIAKKFENVPPLSLENAGDVSASLAQPFLSSSVLSACTEPAAMHNSAQITALQDAVSTDDLFPVYVGNSYISSSSVGANERRSVVPGDCAHLITSEHHQPQAPMHFTVQPIQTTIKPMNPLPAPSLLHVDMEVEQHNTLNSLESSWATVSVSHIERTQEGISRNVKQEIDLNESGAKEEEEEEEFMEGVLHSFQHSAVEQDDSGHVEGDGQAQAEAEEEEVLREEESTTREGWVWGLGWNQLWGGSNRGNVSTVLREVPLTGMPSTGSSLLATAVAAAAIVGLFLLAQQWRIERRRNEELAKLVTQHRRTIFDMKSQISQLQEALTARQRGPSLRSSLPAPFIFFPFSQRNV